MSYATRKILYEKIEKIRKRPLIAYVTSIRLGSQVQMAIDALPYLIKQINSIKDTDSIDLLIISNGGDPVVSWRIISILREKFKKVSILVPYTAYSAATLLAIGADEIIMHSYANLGPLDPQLGFIDEKGKRKSISYEDITKYMEFVKSVGINEQEQLQKSFERLTSEIPPTLIGFAQKSSKLSLTMSQKLLETHMNDQNEIKKITKILNTKFYHHGYPLSKKEAVEIGLPIIDNKEIEDIMWSLYEDYMEEMKFNIQYDPQAIIIDKILKDSPKQKNIVDTINEPNKIASIESSRLNCYIEENIIATYTILNDMSLKSNITIKQGNWTIK